MKKTLIANLLLLVLLIAIFEVVSFSLLPREYTAQFRHYRLATSMEFRPGYLRDYHVPHKTRGFDIGKEKRGQHWVDGVLYPVWSNSLGCFDHEHSSYDEYVYFAGDSFTWGFTPFSEKFGSIVEESTGAQILKCGVSHTGQQHQLEKLSDIVTEIGKSPKAIFVFYFNNDVANDYTHPHTTVIEGLPSRHSQPR